MEGRRNVLVGLFVLCGLAALAAIVILFGRGPTWLVRGDTYPIAIRMRTAEGIRQGTVITVYGKLVGRVEEVRFLDPGKFGEGVDVIANIEQRYVLTEGTRAETTAPGFGSGRPPIMLIPGPLEGPPLPANATIPGTMSSAVESIFPPKIVNTLETAATQIGEAAEAMEPVLRDMHDMLQRRSPSDVDRIGGPQGNISSAAARLDAALKHFNSVLGDAEVQSNVRTAVANFRQTSEDARAMAAELRTASADAQGVMNQLKELLARGQETLRNLDENVTQVSRSTMNGLDKASRFLDFMNEFATTIGKGEGTLGRLLHDERLYEAAVLTFGRMGELVQEMTVLVKDWQKGTIRVGF